MFATNVICNVLIHCLATGFEAVHCLIDDSSDVFLVSKFIPDLWSSRILLLINELNWTTSRNRNWFWYSKKSYCYGNVYHVPTIIEIPILDDLLNFLNNTLNVRFNSVLCNLYLSGTNFIPEHADNEPRLGTNPVICSLSFGSLREMIFRNVKSNMLKTTFLPHGSLLVMQKATQVHWVHSILPDSTSEPRLNLTFRIVH